MKNALLDQIIDPITGFERGVQLNEGIRPQLTGLEAFLNVLPNAGILTLDETVDVGAVFFDQVVTKIENIHLSLGE